LGCWLELLTSKFQPLTFLPVDAGEGPVFGGGEGELNEEGVFELDVPLGLLPALVPPGAGEGERAAGLFDGALVGAGEEGEGVEEAAPFFGGDADGDGRALAVEGEGCRYWDVGAGRELEVGEDGVKLEVVGAVAVEGLRDAEVGGAKEGGELAKGVGELIGIFEAALEEVVLGVAREGGDEFEVKFDDGSGGGEAIEVGVERAEEDFGREGGLGEGEVAGVGGAVFEGEGKVEFGGGALVVFESGAEGLEEAFGDEEDGFMVVDRGLEIVMDAVVIERAVEGEEAVVFAVGDVVETGEFGSESLGEALAGKVGEVLEGFEAPEVKDLGVREGEGFGEGKVGDEEFEGIVLAGGKGGEVGKVGCGSEADLEREGEVGGEIEGVGGPFAFGGDEHGGEVEEEGFGRGEFEVGSERFDEGEGFESGGGFGGGVGIEEEEFGATGEGPGSGDAGVNAEGTGGLVDGGEGGFFALAGGEEGGGLLVGDTIAGEEAAEGEVVKMEGGVVHCFAT
jgi:hypothetical protein